MIFGTIRKICAVVNLDHFPWPKGEHTEKQLETTSLVNRDPEKMVYHNPEIIPMAMGIVVHPLYTPINKKCWKPPPSLVIMVLQREMFGDYPLHILQIIPFYSSPAPHRRVVTARAFGANGIDLIDEDDARGVFSSLTGSCLDRRYTPED